MMHSRRALCAAITATMIIGTGMFGIGAAQAGAADYRFEPVGKPAKSGGATLIRLRLVHLPDSKTVAGAILIQPRLEMGAGAGAMTAPAKVVSSEAKAGEAATVRGQLVLDLVQ